MDSPRRYNVLGVGVSALSLENARDFVVAAARQRPPGAYVCFGDVNSVSCARRDPAHLAALNNSLLTTPDGMPLVWLGHRAGFPGIGRVYGPDLLLEICAATAGTELTHFFHGGGPGTANALVDNLRARFPGLRIAGTNTPPFRELTTAEGDELETRIRTLRPDFFWVGLSTPKQEKFMAKFAPRFDAGVMLGVGAAFDFLSGRVKQAPRWMQRGGLEWLFRLCTEPRRLAPRYFRNNPLFALRVAAQQLGLKKYPPPGI
jgi:N-acetylglucosaminyldiphosphoundecaprenol N-acetyl-beta-D-mannosaminyltransferase